MAENENRSTNSPSTEKLNTQTDNTSQSPSGIPILSSNSPTNRRNPVANRARSRQLWNRAIESVLENDKYTPTSTSVTSSNVKSPPIGWYNLTKRCLKSLYNTSTSSMHTITDYHPLSHDIHENNPNKQHLQTENNKHIFFYSSTPTIINRMNLLGKSNSVMQLNTSPMLAMAAAPALHKDNWQQRRYNFLSKRSMLGGELKENVVDHIAENNEQSTDIEQKPIVFGSQNMASSGPEFEVSNVKRASIFGMAVTGVRNLLSADDGIRSKSFRATTSFDEEQDEDKPEDKSSICLKSIVTTDKTNQHDLTITEETGIIEHDHTDINIEDPCIRTDDSHLPNSAAVSTQIVTAAKHRRLHAFIKNRRLNKFFSRSNQQSEKRLQHKKLADIRESYRSHRPYFTYWITSVQVLVCVISLMVYGPAPLSLRESKNSSIFKQQKSHLTTNPWFGPHPADLIRLGAKYTPCIRAHDEVKIRYNKQAQVESRSGCCIDLTAGHCMQTLSQQCLSRSGLMWYRTPVISKNFDVRKNVIYPAVCGLTPETCVKKLTGNVPREDDSSWTSTVVDSKVFKWSPYAIQWPICLEQDYSRISKNVSLYPHLLCENIARPCCIGVLGDCILTSKEDCHRRRGIYQSQAHLCSQVDCIQNVCGMMEFFVAHLPDQVYRFWTVIFIHAGLIHLLITCIFQYTIMRPLEKLAGCIRVMIIYIVSGFVGSLASALFLPDSVQVGPGGGQCAILACYVSELFLGWRSLKRPWIPFFKIIICLFLLFTVGLLPLVDNYSQCFGFLIGFMLNMIVFPDVSYKKNVRRLVVITAALATTIGLFVALITLFYTVQFECTSCKYFNLS